MNRCLDKKYNVFKHFLMHLDVQYNSILDTFSKGNKVKGLVLKLESEKMFKSVDNSKHTLTSAFFSFFNLKSHLWLETLLSTF